MYINSKMFGLAIWTKNKKWKCSFVFVPNIYFPWILSECWSLEVPFLWLICSFTRVMYTKEINPYMLILLAKRWNHMETVNLEKSVKFTKIFTDLHFHSTPFHFITLLGKIQAFTDMKQGGGWTKNVKYISFTIRQHSDE